MISIEPYSVLMSVYKMEEPEYLRLAIESMLNQSYKPDEFVLVCDGPLTKELDLVIDEMKSGREDLFNVIRLPQNVGLGLALNKGLSKCKNEIVARMDSDDISVSHRMEHQMKFLQDNPDITAVGGHITEFKTTTDNKVGDRVVPLTPDEISASTKNRCPMNHMTVTFRKSDILKVGNYVDFPKLEDYHLWARIVAAGYKMQNLDETLVFARVDDNMYKRRGGMDYFRQTRILEKYFVELGIASRLCSLKNTIIRFCAVVLIPDSIKSFFYNGLMRKKSE